jgi:hypothetical protein
MCVLGLAACGRIGFDSMGDGAVGGAPFATARVTYLKASNTRSNAFFGTTLALSNDGATLAVGSSGETSAATGVGGDQTDTSADRAGAVYMFEHAGTTWSQQAYIKASNARAQSRFGGSLAMSADGNTFAVGADLESSAATGIDGNQADTSAANAGAAYVFIRAGTTWAQQAYVKASNTRLGSQFGVSVALSADGNTLAVGATGESSAATGIGGKQTDNTMPNAGAVYVFTRAGATWSQQAYVKASNTAKSTFFGQAVVLSADGNTLVVGSSSETSGATGIDGDQRDVSMSGAGAAYAFVRVGGTWTQQAYLKASNTNPLTYFGSSVGLSADGNTLAIGAITELSGATGVDGDQADVSAVNSGAVYIFGRAGTVWSQRAYVKASNTREEAFFGNALTVMADGSRMLVASIGEDSGATGIDGDQNPAGPDAGAVYVFGLSGTRWAQQAYVKASNTNAGDQFGTAISSSGKLLAIGAADEASAATGVDGDQTDNSAGGAGAAYVYE